MAIHRRNLVLGALAAPALLGFSGARAAQALKISHQFPGGTIDEGDFRDRLCRKFAADIAKRTDGALSGEVYPNSSLMKTNAQFSALRKGALDMTFYPLAYAGGEVQQLNITLMPCMVSTYTQAQAWKTSPVGAELKALLADKGVIIVSWIWQAGGCVSRAAQLIGPEDAKGQKVRGGSREMDLMFKAAGAAVVSMPSNEAYAAMQTGTVDAVVTSSTSLISFHLDELSKHITAGSRSYWFMFEPLLMSKVIFDALPKPQQEAIMAAGEAMEAFGYASATADDKSVIDIYKAKGAQAHALDEPTLARWKALARDSAWKDYADKSESAAKFMKLAIDVAEKTA